MNAWVLEAGSGLTRQERRPLVPGPGEVVLDVVATGLCHSDLSVMDRPVGDLPYRLPVVLGHEIAGRVARLGEGVASLEVGAEVVVHGPSGCGRCRRCRAGAQQYCVVARDQGLWPPGLGADGGLAPQVLVRHERAVVDASGLDPFLAAPLTDAGLTAFSAISAASRALVPGSRALVVGVGGLGHLAIQCLRGLEDVIVVALDRSAEARALARRCGAHEVASAVEHVAGPAEGFDVVLDFVGSERTLATGIGVLRENGVISIVGLGGGTVAVGLGVVPFGTSVHTPFWGSRDELVEVLDLARGGVLRPQVEVVRMSDVPEAYRAMRAGEVTGRLVVDVGGSA